MSLILPRSALLKVNFADVDSAESDFAEAGFAEGDVTKVDFPDVDFAGCAESWLPSCARKHG